MKKQSKPFTFSFSGLLFEFNIEGATFHVRRRTISSMGTETFLGYNIVCKLPEGRKSDLISYNQGRHHYVFSVDQPVLKKVFSNKIGVRDSASYIYFLVSPRGEMTVQIL